MSRRRLGRLACARRPPAAGGSARVGRRRAVAAARLAGPESAESRPAGTAGAGAVGERQASGARTNVLGVFPRRSSFASPKSSLDERPRCYSAFVPRVRPYCPGCRPNADPIRELLVLRWCAAHAPTLNGPADTAVVPNQTPVWSDEVAGSDNRRWCELFHGRARPNDNRRRDHVGRDSFV